MSVHSLSGSNSNLRGGGGSGVPIAIAAAGGNNSSSNTALVASVHNPLAANSILNGSSDSLNNTALIQQHNSSSNHRGGDGDVGSVRKKHNNNNNNSNRTQSNNNNNNNSNDPSSKADHQKQQNSNNNTTTISSSTFVIIIVLVFMFVYLTLSVSLTYSSAIQFGDNGQTIGESELRAALQQIHSNFDAFQQRVRRIGAELALEPLPGGVTPPDTKDRCDNSSSATTSSTSSTLLELFNQTFLDPWTASVTSENWTLGWGFMALNTEEINAVQGNTSSSVVSSLTNKWELQYPQVYVDTLSDGETKQFVVSHTIANSSQPYLNSSINTYQRFELSSSNLNSFAEAKAPTRVYLGQPYGDWVYGRQFIEARLEDDEPTWEPPLRWTTSDGGLYHFLAFLSDGFTRQEDNTRMKALGWIELNNLLLDLIPSPEGVCFLTDDRERILAISDKELSKQHRAALRNERVELFRQGQSLPSNSDDWEPELIDHFPDPTVRAVYEAALPLKRERLSRNQTSSSSSEEEAAGYDGFSTYFRVADHPSSEHRRGGGSSVEVNGEDYDIILKDVFWGGDDPTTDLRLILVWYKKRGVNQLQRRLLPVLIGANIILFLIGVLMATFIYRGVNRPLRQLERSLYTLSQLDWIGVERMQRETEGVEYTISEIDSLFNSYRFLRQTVLDTAPFLPQLLPMKPRNRGGDATNRVVGNGQSGGGGLEGDDDGGELEDLDLSEAFDYEDYEDFYSEAGDDAAGDSSMVFAAAGSGVAAGKQQQQPSSDPNGGGGPFALSVLSDQSQTSQQNNHNTGKMVRGGDRAISPTLSQRQPSAFAVFRLHSKRMGSASTVRSRATNNSHVTSSKSVLLSPTTSSAAGGKGQGSFPDLTSNNGVPRHLAASNSFAVRKPSFLGVGAMSSGGTAGAGGQNPHHSGGVEDGKRGVTRQMAVVASAQLHGRATYRGRFDDNQWREIVTFFQQTILRLSIEFRGTIISFNTSSVTLVWHHIAQAEDLALKFSLRANMLLKEGLSQISSGNFTAQQVLTMQQQQGSRVKKASSSSAAFSGLSNQHHQNITTTNNFPGLSVEPPVFTIGLCKRCALIGVTGSVLKKTFICESEAVQCAKLYALCGRVIHAAILADDSIQPLFLGTQQPAAAASVAGGGSSGSSLAKPPITTIARRGSSNSMVAGGGGGEDGSGLDLFAVQRRVVEFVAVPAYQGRDASIKPTERFLYEFRLRNACVNNSSITGASPAAFSHHQLPQQGGGEYRTPGGGNFSDGNTTITTNAKGSPLLPTNSNAWTFASKGGGSSTPKRQQPQVLPVSGASPSGSSPAASAASSTTSLSPVMTAAAGLDLYQLQIEGFISGDLTHLPGYVLKAWDEEINFVNSYYNHHVRNGRNLTSGNTNSLSNGVGGLSSANSSGQVVAFAAGTSEEDSTSNRSFSTAAQQQQQARPGGNNVAVTPGSSGMILIPEDPFLLRRARLLGINTTGGSGSADPTLATIGNSPNSRHSLQSVHSAATPVVSAVGGGAAGIAGSSVNDDVLHETGSLASTAAAVTTIDVINPLDGGGSGGDGGLLAFMEAVKAGNAHYCRVLTCPGSVSHRFENHTTAGLTTQHKAVREQVDAISE